MDTSAPDGDAAALLSQARDAWAGSPAWTMTGTDRTGPRVFAAVRPGLDWVDATEGHMQVLVQDGTAYVRGALGLAMLLGGPVADRLGGDDGRWVEVPASEWWRRGQARGAVDMYGEDIGRAEEIVVDDVAPAADGGSLVRLVTDSGRYTVHRRADSTVVLVGLDDVVDGESIAGFSAVIGYGDEPLDLPDPTADGVRSVAEALPAAGPTARRPRRRHPVTIEVLPPEEPGEPWGLYSDDLPAAFGVEAGHEAEALALQLLAERRPDLLHLVEGDSYDVEFSAYVPDEATARAVVDVLRDAGS